MIFPSKLAYICLWPHNSLFQKMRSLLFNKYFVGQVLWHSIITPCLVINWVREQFLLFLFDAKCSLFKFEPFFQNPHSWNFSEVFATSFQKAVNFSLQSLLFYISLAKNLFLVSPSWAKTRTSRFCEFYVFQPVHNQMVPP